MNRIWKSKPNYGIANLIEITFLWIYIVASLGVETHVEYYCIIGPLIQHCTIITYICLFQL